MASFVRCDFCKREVERLSAKIYFTPVLPGKPAIMANYSHHADACNNCAVQLLKQMNKRRTRKEFNAKRSPRS